MEKQYQVYMLVNERGFRYIGISENVDRRLAQHNAGLSNWTAKRGPWRLAWSSETLNLSDARGLENLLKRQRGGAGLDSIIKGHRQAGS